MPPESDAQVEKSVAGKLEAKEEIVPKITPKLSYAPEDMSEFLEKDKSPTSSNVVRSSVLFDAEVDVEKSGFFRILWRRIKGG